MSRALPRLRGVIMGGLAAAAAAEAAPNPQARLHTAKGVVAVELLFDKTPRAVSHFVELVRAGRYDGSPVHLAVPERVAAFGGTTPLSYCIADELSSDVRHDRPGILSFVSETRDGNGGEVQLLLAPAPQHDGRLTAFGVVVDGLDAARALAADSGARIDRVELVGELTPTAFDKIPRLTADELRTKVDGSVRRLATALGAELGLGKLEALESSEVRSECGEAQIAYAARFERRAGARLLALIESRNGQTRIRSLQFDAGD
jgi:peptidyl-prolyl cis-trans isomerase B (cyclophilin B)